MKIPKRLTAALTVGEEEVLFRFRPPTNEELNKFLASRFEVGRRGSVKSNALEARVEFFDLLIESVENLEDDDGTPITGDQKDKIPMNWKNDVVFRCFEDTEINIKN